ncbi:phosphate ABC transporter, inner membrane subunit PstC [Pirellula staleyi DSM 6068]|uniref:Phosphate transport system permease protein n=1 Tax=Pirellula staleyi (strain ATCC 27377 / DSM 6068 / ICPB 4128) TaxID=530564 RepID=D2R7P4_PIRSD|nr:phosphate ABC transporter permease subunit PstC [Pirellula staleyi]ADB17470.1 phosphate ABC transporter, inner membrane subunit PstC [Pirellula staleyi DSM 6068]
MAETASARPQVKRLRTRQKLDKTKRRIREAKEMVISIVLFLAASSSVLITAGIVGVLIYESIAFFRDVSVIEFLTGTTWTPQFANPKYGILPLVSGTLVTTAVALAVALPIGTIAAVYLSEFAPFVVRETIKPTLELLSAVPTVVYGYFALNFVAPVLQYLCSFVGIELSTFSMLSAGIVMGIMIIPYVSSLSEDAMRSVPMLLREGSYALGGNRITTAINVVIPSALSGIGAAYILGISRAIGETMIVAVAAGMQPKLTLNPTEQAATITAFIVQVSLGDLPHGSAGYQSIFAAGLVLFSMTLMFNIAGYVLRRRYHQAY